MATPLSPEVRLMRRCVRHVHIPDLPPLYAPRSLPGDIRDYIHGQIIRQRAVQQEPPPPEEVEYGPGYLSSGVQSFTSWVRRAGPPPTVLSFTRRPTYILPKHKTEKQEPWQVEYLTRALQSRMDLRFPEPPQWSSRPWRPFWERDKGKASWKHDPLNHTWPEVGVLIMPCAEPMFLGPGQVSIWPIIDLEDEIQRGSTSIRTKYEFARVLEDTTIELLRREFGLHGFSIPGSDGVWVESRIPPPEVDEGQNQGHDLPTYTNMRRIATIHTSFKDRITQWGVSIHVGQPSPMQNAWTSPSNPWTPIRQQNITTSIATELSHMNMSAGPLGPSKYLFTYFSQDPKRDTVGQGAIPYSLIKTSSSWTAPLGMDNRDISTAWTYEFARQLGIKDGTVDKYGRVRGDDQYATDKPTNTSGAGFRSRGVFSEDSINSSCRQVDVPHILVVKHGSRGQAIAEASPRMDRRDGIMSADEAQAIANESMRIERKDGRIDAGEHDGWLLSWPLWREVLLRKLDEAICGGPSDTRLRAYAWQREVSARLQRRRTELRIAQEVEEAWRTRQPLAELIRELTRRSREVEEMLAEVPMGSKSAKLLDSIIHIRRIIETHFAGSFGTGAGNTEPEQGDDLPEKSDRLPEQKDSFAAMGDMPDTTRAARGTPTPSVNEETRQNPLGQEKPAAPSGRKKKHQERIKKLEDRLQYRLTPRPHFEFTKTWPERQREKLEARRKRTVEQIEQHRQAQLAEERDKGLEDSERPMLKDADRGASAAEAPRSSPYLPKTHQIGGS